MADITIDERDLEKQLRGVMLKIEHDVVDQIQKESKKQIVQMNMMATGELSNSFVVIEDEAEPSVTLVNDAPYASAVNDGAAAHYPPWENIVPWVKAKMGKSGKDAERTARAIANDIQTRGTEPKPFFSNAVKNIAYKLGGRSERH